MTWLIVLLLLLVLIVLILMYFRIGQPGAAGPGSTPPPASLDPADLTIREATVGDTLLIPGAGDQYSDLNVTVDRRAHYESGGDEWFELSGLYRGRRVFVEVSGDDQLEVSINLADTELTLADLGLTEDDLIQMDEQHDRSQTLEYDGSRWRFQWSGEVRYFENDRKPPEGFYVWDFEEIDGPRQLYVEKWEGEPFEVGMARRVHPDEVRVFRR